MEHMVTDLNDPNESVMFSRYILGNFYFDTLFEELEARLSPCATQIIILNSFT
jgi:hypothetical protein